MADASRFAAFSTTNPPAGPRDWRDAFAALPQEAPDAPRWPALAHALRARRTARVRRRRIGLALAAGLCALAMLPFALRRPADTPAPAPRPAVAATPPAVAAGAAIAIPALATSLPSPGGPAIADAATTDTTMRRRAVPQPTTHRAPPRERRRVLAMREDPRPESHGGDAATDPSQKVATGVAEATLDTLYAASAQLESLLALARDTRVDSGPAAALAGDYDAELAAIDAHLAQPALSPGEQLRLWQARVDTLEQAAGLESQLRTLAASGGRLDGALVTID